MRTILRAYKSKKDFYSGKPLDFRFCDTNENDNYEPTFIHDFAMGIVEGLRCKYAAPFVAAFHIYPDGKEKFIDGHGGDNLRH